MQDADEDRRSLILLGFADRKMHREGRSVLAPAEDLAADADDLAFAGTVIIRKITVMGVAIERRHQDLDVLSDHLVGRILEQLLASRVQHQHAALRVDQDDSIDGGFDDGAQPFGLRANSA